jgi:hypothetical protein
MSQNLEKLLRETLTTAEYTEVCGVVPVNVADGLFAIAAALNRIATISERSLEMAQQRIERLEAMVDFEMGPTRQ